MNNRVAIAATAVLLLATGCANDAESAGPFDRQDFGTPGYVKAMTADVEFYPACGNEVLTFEGTTWYQYDPANIDEFPDPRRNIESWISGGFGDAEEDAVIDTDADAALGSAPDVAASLPGVAVSGGGGGALAMSPGVPRVAAPELGDDIGVLVEYSGNIAYWESNSKKLATWLTTTEIEYNWVC